MVMPCVPTSGSGRFDTVWYDTYTQAAGNFPNVIPMFNQSDVQKGRHLTNNPEGNRLPAGHELVIRGISFNPLGVTVADFNAFLAASWFTMTINGVEQRSAKIQHYPSTGGTFTDASVQNGVPGAGGVILWDENAWIALVEGVQFQFSMNVSGVVAAAAAFNLMWTYHVDWKKI